jgi:hypothetical protein
MQLSKRILKNKFSLFYQSTPELQNVHFVNRNKNVYIKGSQLNLIFQKINNVFIGVSETQILISYSFAAVFHTLS